MAAVLTRYQYEVILVARCKGPLARASMSVVTDPANPNLDLNEPLATALDELGVPPGDRSLVIDADFTRLSPALQGRYIDLAEIRTLETAYQQVVMNPQLVQWEDYRTDQGSNWLTALQAFITSKWDRYRNKWLKSGAPVIGAMCDTNQRELRTGSYYPPFPLID